MHLWFTQPDLPYLVIRYAINLAYYKQSDFITLNLYWDLLYPYKNGAKIDRRQLISQSHFLTGRKR